MIEYLKEKALVIEILGKQSDKGGRKPVAPPSGGSDGYKSKADQLEVKLVRALTAVLLIFISTEFLSNVS